MIYPRYVLKEELEIRKLISFHYRELSRYYHGKGESHDFWELVYVDKGEIEVVTDSRILQLAQGDIAFYKPNEFHEGKALKDKAIALIIITFDCTASCMDFFVDNSFSLRDEERAILTKLVKEGRQNFDPPIDSPKKRTLVRSLDAPFGSEQLIRNYLEILLIELIRHGGKERRIKTVSTTAHEQRSQELVDRVIEYMLQNLADVISVEQLCARFAISRTKLKMAFRMKTNMGIIEFYNYLKIERAKLLIRENKGNFTEISTSLGYYSVHYFSRRFKDAIGMSPTEYSRSIKSRGWKT